MKLNRLLLSTLVPFTLINALDLYPEVSGQITYLKNIGDKVNKGEKVIQIDTQQIDAKIKKEEAKLAYLKIILDDKMLIESQNQELYESTVLPKRDLDLIVLKRQLAQEKYNEQKAFVEFYKLEKKKYTIISPIKGTISDIPNRRNVTNTHQPQLLMKIK